jgi:hypothetical protein
MGKLGSARALRWMVTATVAAAALVAAPGVASAISGGEYSPAQQDCSKEADAYSNKDQAERGCHTLKLNVESGDTRYAEAGIDQMPDGSSTGVLLGVGTPGDDNFPHAGCAAVNTDGTGGGEGNNCGTDDPTGEGVGAGLVGDANTQDGGVTPSTGAPDVAGTAGNLSANGLEVYMGADDNLDAGEHDGVDNQPATGTEGIANGPSDGGAVHAHVRPAADPTPSASNPVPVAGASFGSCADGICEEVTTYRHAVYQGGGTGERDVANYEGKDWDPYTCSSGNLDDEMNCFDGDHPGGMNDYRNAEGTVYAEPGVQVYEDPDPQASPIDPVKELQDGASGGDNEPTLYPLPGTYAGTCGVIVDGAEVSNNPAQPC